MLRLLIGRLIPLTRVGMTSMNIQISGSSQANKLIILTNERLPGSATHLSDAQILCSQAPSTQPMDLAYTFCKTNKRSSVALLITLSTFPNILLFSEKIQIERIAGPS